MTEPGVPHRFESGEQRSGTSDLLVVAAYETLTSMAVFAHEASSFQHGDVFLHSRETHVVVGCECADRGLTGEGPPNDVTSCRVGERSEEAIDLGVRHLGIYNHMVVD